MAASNDINQKAILGGNDNTQLLTILVSILKASRASSLSKN